jgi:hypothetical protein
LSKRGRVLLATAAGVLIVAALPHVDRPQAVARAQEASPSPTFAVPTVAVSQATPVDVPTVTLPQPTPTPTPKPVRKHRQKRHPPRAKPTPTPTPTVRETWIWAYLTSYCPGSAGWISSSGMPVFYGMLANNFYAFGTRVYIPVLGITGTVEDRQADYSWNHFDVWSSSCYSTPTGWFRVAVLG